MNRVISSIWGKLEEKTQRGGGGGGDGVGGYSKGKVVKYKTWCGTVEKKAQALLSLFKLLDASDAEKKEKFGIISTKVTLAINEFISMLQTTTFKNSDSGSHHSSSGSGSGNNSSNSGSSSNSSNSSSSASLLQDNIRATLLEVWNPLLQSLGKLELADVMAVAAVHKAVLLLMAREEFSCEALLNSITSSSSTPKEISANKDVIVRYRAMLITTLYAATSRLVDKPNPSVFSTTTATNSMNNMVFASKVLAILYWRLPQQVGQAISKILEIPDMELLAPVLSFPAFPDDHPTSSPRAQTLPQPFHGHGHGPSHHVAGLHRTTISSGSGSNNSNTNTNTNTNTNSNNSGTASNSSSSSSLDLNSSSSSLGTSNGVSARNSSNINSNVKGSPLFGWTDLYKEVPPMESYLQKDNGPWLAVLAKFDVTYITFFKEWILHVTSVIPGKVEWTSITGFPRLLQSLLYQMRTKEQPPPPLTKPYPLLELQYLLLNQTHAELIDAYIKAAFLRTNVFDLLSVLNTINLTEGWFSEMNEHDYSLPKTFDINFFCSGLEILLETDHHQTLLRVITLVYNFSELFEGQHRAALFDVLLTKQFYQLFMHWDPGVRNAYQQLLIFKMVRIKRSTLYNDGYVVKEMARVGVTSYQSSKESGPDGQGNGNNSGPFTSLLSTRSGSGFFSTFSNVLPSIFSLSAPPSDDASPSSPPPTTTTTTATSNSNGTDSSNGSQGNGVLPSSHRDSSSTSSSTTTTTPTKPTPQTNSTTPTTPTTASTNSVNPYIKMGIERTSSGPLNGTKPGNNDNSNATSSSTSSTSPSTSSTSPSSSASTSTSTSNGNLDVDEFYDMESGSSGHPTAADDVKKHHSGAAVTIGDDAAKSVDVQLFLKLNSYLKIIEDQLRKPNAKKAFDARLEAYAPYALAEFNQHLARYHQWELKNESPPRLMSLPFLRMGEG